MVYRQTARSAKVRATARAKILRAARKLFSERGYDETTMQQIVREAKTSIGNAYFYFSNKEDLLTTILEESIRSTWARADPLIDSVEPGAARIAVAVYGNIIHLLTSEKDLARIAVTGAPRAVRRLVELSFERLMGLLAANFPDQSAEDRITCAVAIGGANRTGIELSLTGQIDVPPRELAVSLLTWHLRALNLPEVEIARVLGIVALMVTADEAVTKPPPRPKASRAKALRV